MSSSRPRDPKNDTTSTEGGGVRVIVRDRPLPEPRQAPEEPREAGRRAIVVPEHLPVDERNAILASLTKEHGDFILETLGRYQVNQESVKDLRQRVLLVLLEHVEQRKPLPNPRGFIVNTARNEVANHKRAGQARPPVGPQGTEVDEVPAATTDPEGKTTRAELKHKIGVYISRLPPELAQVVRAMDFLGLTIEGAAQALGRPRATVDRQHKRAWEQLKEMVLASERGTVLAAQLRK